MYLALFVISTHFCWPAQVHEKIFKILIKFRRVILDKRWWNWRWNVSFIKEIELYISLVIKLCFRLFVIFKDFSFSFLLFFLAKKEFDLSREKLAWRNLLPIWQFDLLGLPWASCKGEERKQKHTKKGERERERGNGWTLFYSSYSFAAENEAIFQRKRKIKVPLSLYMFALPCS